MVVSSCLFDIIFVEDSFRLASFDVHQLRSLGAFTSFDCLRHVISFRSRIFTFQSLIKVRNLGSNVYYLLGRVPVMAKCRLRQ